MCVGLDPEDWFSAGSPEELVATTLAALTLSELTNLLACPFANIRLAAMLQLSQWAASANGNSDSGD